MLIAVLILTVLMICIGWYTSKDMFSPYVAAPGVWAIAILIYYFLPNTFYSIKGNFPFVLSIWLIGFFISSIIGDFFTTNASMISCLRKPNMTVLNIYTIIVCICVPIYCGIIVHQAFTEEPEKLFRYMRVMNTGQSEDIEMPKLGILTYTITLAYVMIFFGLLYFKSKTIKVVIILLNILIAMVTMAKIAVLSILFSSLYLCFVKKYIKLRHMAYGMIVFIGFSFLIQDLRHDLDDTETTNFLALYLSSSMVAFDYYALPCSSIFFGEYTFRIFYAIGHVIGLTSAPSNTILEFVSIPDTTNTYTCLYPFYTDFGILGVLIGSIIYGLFYGYLYKKCKTGGKYELILYAIFLTYILLGFFAELIFTNMSITLQYMFFALLPFLLGSKNIDTITYKIKNK